MQRVRSKTTRISVVVLLVGFVLLLVCWLYLQNSSRLLPTGGRTEQSSPAVDPEENASAPVTRFTDLRSFAPDPARQGFGSYLKGRVLSKVDERPVSGAGISLYLSQDPLKSQRFSNLASALATDSDGFFELKHEEQLEGWLVVEKAGFAAIEEFISFEADEVGERLYLLEPARAFLQGVVFEAGGRKPVPGVFIGISFPRINSGNAATTGSRSTVTDSEGRFAIEGIKAGEVMLTALARGYLSSGLVFGLGEDEQKTVEIFLTKGEERLLEVKNRRGEPIPDAWVYASRPDSPPGFFRSDRNGEVKVLVPKEAERIEATVAALGYVPRRITIDPAFARPEVVLESTDALSGRVVSNSGTPVPGAFVSARSLADHGFSFEGQGSGKTDENGYFTFYPNQLRPEQLTIRHSEYLPAVVDLTAGKTAPGLEVRLRRPEGGICGRVLNSKRVPLVHFTLLVRSAEPGGQAPFFFQKFFANADGRFEILTMPAGKFSVEVMNPNSGVLQKAGLVTVLKGQVTEINVVRREF